MGRMKELFIDQLNRMLDRSTPREHLVSEDLCYMAYVKNYTDGTTIPIGAFSTKDIAWRKALQYINHRKIDAAQPEVKAITWREYESL